ncbi:hypothetical protein Mhun_3142 [Methanospirillum hungatei JF-1]|uniref:Glycosyltransferase RgtA/B/C/D-like domain-containing protein n=1 Tax=Methanospirillum hungatei JF-1 (strain ATCC 27890 / DSM 864 / NBRC 100397 / JF-1) TaxID=323259 RepID=Q2FUM6_METHJ|nr:hypothetical protein [Methanospirillum hungatei]ABD42827.1 hypothetical protein Mhun_3142 [Methanospirillum hungatei JF-1]
MAQITKDDIIIMLVLAGFSFCICFGISSPSLYMNDEWITTNQLNQLFTGNQFIENEGKYGKLFTGEMGAYFTTRDNYLAYSLMLPVISTPSLFLIYTAGDSFRLLFLVFWFLVGTGTILTCVRIASDYKRKNIERIFLIILFAFFGLFLLNIYFYQPFESTWADSPIESAAIIFTNTILFSFIPSMIYIIFRYIQMSRIVSIFGSLSVICCSSYLFWAGSAKDHLLIAFLITFLVYVFTIYQVKSSYLHVFSLFVVGGLICWARPEYGSFILGGLVIWEFGSLYKRKKDTKLKLLHLFQEKEIYACISGIFIGLVPFFLNNILITKNPLIPPQYLYVANSRTNVTSIIQDVNSENVDVISQGFYYLNQIFTFFSPGIEEILDLYRLFWISPNGSLGILLICPIIIPALIYGIRAKKNNNKYFSKETVSILLFSFFIIVLTVLAYARVIHGSTVSEGSLPDMRYFSPLYIPMGIISVILLSPQISLNQQRWLNYSLFSVFIISPLLIIAYQSIFLDGFSLYIHFSLMIKILLIVYLSIAVCATIYPGFWDSKNIFPTLYAIMLGIPSSIQLMIILIYSHVKMNGYPFWQPVLQYLFTYVIQIVN